MESKHKLSVLAKITVAALLIASLGVVIQILSGASYPPVPPVFFILLLPAMFIALSSRKWVPVLAVLAGMFLTMGLFTSGASVRLIRPVHSGDTVGLWIQSIAVIVAIVAASFTTFQNYSKKIAS